MQNPLNSSVPRTIKSVVFALCLFSGAAYPWGQEGHKIVGEIATRYLTPEASEQVSALLADDLGANGKPSGRTTLGEVASWPDEIRGTPAGANNASWHFEDIPVCGQATEDQICPGGNCASVQLARLSEVLRDPGASPHDRNEALKWVVHLVGDIHQPLHAADNNKDRGGNNVRVTFFGQGSLNLHKIWDVQIVEKVVTEAGGESAFVNRTVSPEQVNAWVGGTVQDWMQESNQFAKEVAYGKLPLGFSCGTVNSKTEPIAQSYYADASPVVDQQLWKAGVRLASLLNAAFENTGETKSPSSSSTTTETSTATHADTESAGSSPSASGPPLLPDSTKTPGKASYLDEQTVCSMGATKDIRNVPEKAKNQVYEDYGIAKCQGYCNGPQGCEIDHLISLELGGANTVDNLWPQPYDGDWNAHDKDRLENTLHKLVCVDKSITLREAQEVISKDWIAAYKKYVGETTPFKPVKHCGQ